MADTIKVTLVKSPIGAVPKHKKTVKAMGLTKMHKTVRDARQRCNQRNDSAGAAPGKSRRLRRCQNGIIKLKTRRGFQA